MSDTQKQIAELLHEAGETHQNENYKSMRSASHHPAAGSAPFALQAERKLLVTSPDSSRYHVSLWPNSEIRCRCDGVRAASFVLPRFNRHAISPLAFRNRFRHAGFSLEKPR